MPSPPLLHRQLDVRRTREKGSLRKEKEEREDVPDAQTRGP